MLNHEIGMLTTVIIGNSSTFLYDDKIITPRGYQRKYTLNSEKQTLKPHQRLQKEAEPWALDQEETVTETAGGVGLLTEAPEKKQLPMKWQMEALSRVKGQVVKQPFSRLFSKKWSRYSNLRLVQEWRIKIHS